jgi:hypothetical protein
VVPLEDLDGMRELLSAFVGAGLEGEPRDAAELELLALDAIGPFAHPDLPASIVELFPQALAERNDELAAGILVALAELAPAQLAAPATEARDRLARAGVVSPLAARVGTLEARECYRLELGDGDAEMLGALLQRPGDAKAQAVVLFVEHEECGGVIVHGLLGGPEKPAAVRRLLRTPHPGDVAEPIAGDELSETLRSALEHMVDHDLELSVDLLPPLLVLERALGGDWLLPPLGQGEEVVELLRADADELTDAFAAEYGDEGAGVADEMCHWKVDYVGGLVERWTAADVEEFLLGWYPRKGGGGVPVEAVPDNAIAFLRFLDERGRLSGDELEALVDTVEQLRDRFERAASDRRNWGPAKAMVMQMRAEGVDLMDQEAVAAWTASFNARTFEERDRVLGPSLPRPVPRTAQKRKAQRRSAKASRKRNRC